MKIFLKREIGEYIKRYPDSQFVRTIREQLRVELLDRRLIRHDKTRSGSRRSYLALTKAERTRMDYVLVGIAEMLIE